MQLSLECTECRENDHVAGTDKGGEPWISDEGGRGQVTLREKENVMACITLFPA